MNIISNPHCRICDEPAPYDRYAREYVCSNPECPYPRIEPVQVEFTDPYKLVDPTDKNMPAPVTGRTNSGRFTGYSVLSNMTDNHFPIESKYWRIGTFGARAAIEKLGNGKLIPLIVPDEYAYDFSWRMLCEMTEKTLESLRADGSDIAAVNAAHEYLIEKQKKLETTEQEATRVANAFDFEKVKEVPYE